MKAVRLKAEDIRVFCDAAGAFFRESTRRPATVRTAYVFDGPEASVVNDYQGVIELDGLYCGTVTFSAPRGLLSHLLLLLGERDYSEASHRDIVGEIANQMAGYARRHFGEGMAIKPPKVLPRGMAAVAGGEGVPFAIPMNWERYEAHLLVRMAPGG